MIVKLYLQCLKYSSFSCQSTRASFCHTSLCLTCALMSFSIVALHVLKKLSLEVHFKTLFLTKIVTQNSLTSFTWAFNCILWPSSVDGVCTVIMTGPVNGCLLSTKQTPSSEEDCRMWLKGQEKASKYTLSQDWFVCCCCCCCFFFWSIQQLFTDASLI